MTAKHQSAAVRGPPACLAKPRPHPRVPEWNLSEWSDA
jgi:hypothetical protein